MDNFMDKLAQKYNAQEMIMANSQAEAAKMQSLQEQVEAYEAVLQEMRKLNYKNTELTEKMYSLVDESIEKVRNLQLEAVQGTASTELVTKEMSEAVTSAFNEAINNLDAVLKMDLSAEALSASAAAVQNSATMVQSSADEFKIVAGSMQENIQGIQTGVGSMQESVQSMQTGMGSVQESMQSMQTGMGSVQESMQSMQTGMGSVQETVQNMHTDMREGMSDLYESINHIQSTVAGLTETIGQPQNIQAVESDELRNSVNELSSSVAEVNTGIRNLKSSNDDVKTVLKTALESGIYGLKQDNREIVEFMQRMNTNLTAKKVNPEQERKEAEAKEKEAADKQALEERFKTVEDFMHKESVKVYRNVQAVINEKIDRQSQGDENRDKQTTAQIKQVKTVAVIAVVLGAANIILSVLNILGII